MCRSCRPCRAATYPPHPSKREGRPTSPPPPVTESTHAYCGSFHWEDFFLTVAQAASELALPTLPPSANTAFCIIMPLAKGATGKHMAHPAGSHPLPLQHARAVLHLGPRRICTLCASQPWQTGHDVKNLYPPGQPGAAVVSFLLFFCLSFFFLTPALLPAAEQTRTFRRLFHTLPEMGPKGWSSGLCSR